MGNKTLDVILGSGKNLIIVGGLAASAVLYSCNYHSGNGVDADGGPKNTEARIGELTGQDPFLTSNIWDNESRKLLKKIHDDPYNRTSIEDAIAKGIPPYSIYNAIEWHEVKGINDLENAKKILLNSLNSRAYLDRNKTADAASNPELNDIAETVNKKMQELRGLNKYAEDIKNPQTAPKVIEWWINTYAK